MREKASFIPISTPPRDERYQQVLEQGHRITRTELVKPKEHLALPYPSTNYDFLAINVPSSYQQGMIPDGEEPPWGMLRVVATARERFGFNAGILDAHRLKLTPFEIRQQILNTKAKLIGLNPTSVNVSEARVIADVCDELQIPYILGGIHATLDPRIARLVFPEAFAIVRGNGELAIKEVLEAFHKNEPRSVESGIYYWDQAVDNSFYATKMKPGDIPLIKQDVYIEQPIYTHTVTLNGNAREIHEATLFVTDGCPFECTFCSSPVMVNRKGDIPYARSEMSRIIDEVDDVVSLGADAIHFLDDMAFIKGVNIEDFYKGIKERGLLGDFIWRGLTRAPVVLRSDFDDKVMGMMKESGAWKIALGIESGNNDVLKKIKKQVTREQVIAAVAKLASCGIQVKGFFIFGLPGETEPQMRDTLEFIDELREIGLTEIAAFQFKPYPGTQEYFELLQTKPDIINKLGYLRRRHKELSGKAQEKADNHVWLPDDIQIADVPSLVVREYVEQALKNFYGNSNIIQQNQVVYNC